MFLNINLPGRKDMTDKQIYPMISEKSWRQIRNQFKKTIPSVVNMSYRVFYQPLYPFLYLFMHFVPAYALKLQSTKCLPVSEILP